MIITEETVRHWLTLKALSDSAKAQEMSARKDIVNDTLGENRAGTVHFQAGDLEATATASMDFKVKREDIMSFGMTLTDAERECIRWSPSIVIGKYKKLPKDSPLRKIVTAKLGSPTLKANDLEIK